VTLHSGRPIHFIGIGGAGMSAIAKVLLEQGRSVSGSDIKRSRATNMLETLGARVRIGHRPDGIPDEAVVVVSSAIAESNPELVGARERGHTLLSRGEALAWVLQDHKAIVVAGTHGKTSTTSMVATILQKSGLDPTYLIGGGLNDSGTNARHGTDSVAVAESDESDGSFLLLHPSIAVVTNMEVDHVDYWRSLDALRDGFTRFLDGVTDAGTIIVPATDPTLVAVANRTGRNVLTFDGEGDVRADEIDLGSDGASFVLTAAAGSVPVQLMVPGRHNISNALAAAAAAIGHGIELGVVADGLNSYQGVERRFETRGRSGGVTVIDDYAHHPTEVRATLAAARQGPWHRVIAVFQPHRYSRTAAFVQEFGGAFSDADQVVITDVYGAGEAPVPGVTGKLVADAVSSAHPGRLVAYFPHRAELISYLAVRVRPGDAVFTLGAGDITSVGEELIGRLDQPT
jgi:UDP-N-acetylmuramate--alanine ligase